MYNSTDQIEKHTQEGSSEWLKLQARRSRQAQRVRLGVLKMGAASECWRRRGWLRRTRGELAGFPYTIAPAADADDMSVIEKPVDQRAPPTWGRRSDTALELVITADASQ